MMKKKIFLTSSIHRVANDIARRLAKASGRDLVFITTASEPVSGDLKWQADDRRALVRSGFRVADYTVTGKSNTQIKKDLSEFDVMCVEGGNTFYLLKQFQRSRCLNILRLLVEKGMSYIGSSAGSIVAGPDIYPSRRTDPPDEFLRLKSYKGLGLVNFIVLPHWGSADWKKLYLSKRLGLNYNEDHKLFLLNDHQYVVVENDELKFIDVRFDR